MAVDDGYIQCVRNNELRMQEFSSSSCRACSPGVFRERCSPGSDVDYRDVGKYFDSSTLSTPADLSKYKKVEQPIRMGLWYLGTGGGTIVGALSSYGFQHYVGTTFKTWQIMFLMWGLITIAVGILIVIFLPDNPMTSRLSHEEKIFAIERLRSNRTGIENKTFKVHQMVECLRDPHTWIISLITVSSSVTNGAVSSFQATIIKG